MTIWMTLGRLFPCNREGKWPLAVQFLVFLLFEALFIWGVAQASALASDPTMSNWAMDVFGIEHFDKFLTFLSTLITAEVCAWRIGLQRYITFGGHTPRRWTILPITLGYLALSLIIWLGSRALLTVELPLPTDNMMVYTVLHNLLYAGIVVVFCAGIFYLRKGEKSHVLRLAAAEIVLILLLVLCTACDGQIRKNMLNDYFEPVDVIEQVKEEHLEYNIPIDVTGQVKAEYPEYSIPESATSGYAYIIELNPNATWEAGTPIIADIYEEAMKPSDTLGTILMWVQLIPIFFAMKRWLFVREEDIRSTK